MRILERIFGKPEDVEAHELAWNNFRTYCAEVEEADPESLNGTAPEYVRLNSIVTSTGLVIPRYWRK